MRFKGDKKRLTAPCPEKKLHVLLKIRRENDILNILYLLGEPL